MGLIIMLYIIAIAMAGAGIKLFCYGMKGLGEWGKWGIAIAILILLL